MAVPKPKRAEVPPADPEALALARERTLRDLRVSPDLDYEDRLAHHLRRANEWLAWKRAKRAR